jgi:hypothetical protein
MASVVERLEGSVGSLRVLFGDRDASTAAGRLDDDELLRGLGRASDARAALDLVEAALAAEVQRRSDHGSGYDGLAQRRGHRNGTALIQQVTGRARPGIERASRAGADLAAALGPPAPTVVPWFAPLTHALGAGTISRDQFDAIRRNLGEPPVDRYPDSAPQILHGIWAEAASALIEEAQGSLVEDLRIAARVARDTLDPIGTQLRFDERFAARSLRVWIDDAGQHNACIRFDDDMAAWVRTILSAALRPRRGPRFVAPGAEAGAAAHHEADGRTNEQLQYDTLVAVLRTGAEADPRQAFGDRQPGIRIVVTQPQLDRRGDAAARPGTAFGVAHLEETRQTIPGTLLETYLCNAATTTVTVDSRGGPLDVGREKRLFTAKQRDAMAIRDGGCLGCGAEPSRCEAHHIDHWLAHSGRTDIADGVLLCRNCHLRLHSQRSRITRDPDGGYWMHGPPGSEGRPRP